MTSPLPARQDPSTPQTLRRGLDALAAIDPPYDVAAGATRLEAQLSGAPLPLAAARRTGGTKLFVILAVVVLGAAVAGLLRREDDGRTNGNAIAGAEPNPSADVEPDSADEPLAAAVEQPTLPQNESASVAPPSRPDPPSDGSEERPSETNPPETVERRQPRPRAEPVAEPTDDPLMREMKLLNATRKHVARGRHAEAIVAIAEARTLATRRFDEEWEALEILALAGSGRHDRARALAEPYLVQHEGGRFNASIERALERP